jgi:hypothetical protein
MSRASGCIASIHNANLAIAEFFVKSNKAWKNLVFCKKADFSVKYCIYNKKEDRSIF